MALWSQGRLVSVREWRTASTPTLAEGVRHYLADLDCTPVSACFAVAGPTDGESATLTNTDWSGNVGWLGFPALLVNDLYACAVGVGRLGPADSEVLIDAPVGRGPALVIGVGTGLGQAVLLADGHVLAGEGGHADFAPADAEQMAFRQWLGDRVPRVTVDEVLSGRGMAAMLHFVAMASGEDMASDKDMASGEDAVMERLGPDLPKAVTERADVDPLCRRARDLFLRCLAGEAVNLALRVIPRSGVYLCGGVVDHLGAALACPVFRETWTRTGAIGTLLRGISCRRVTRPHLALLGAGPLAERTR